jgi:hypothetical protein
MIMDLLKRRERRSGEDRTRPAGQSATSTSGWSDAPVDEPRGDTTSGSVVDPPSASPPIDTPPPRAEDRHGYEGRHDPDPFDTAVDRTIPTRAVDRDRDNDGVDDRDEGRTPDRHEVVEDVVVTRWSIADLVVTLIGAALALAGAVGLIRAEIDSSWYDPVVGVAGGDHTALLAAAELGAGVLIALAGIARRRVIATLLGLALAVGAAVAAIETAEVSRELAIEDWWAWMLCGAGVVVVLMALVPRKGRIRRMSAES